MANSLGKKLWEKIEAPQGYAYISDDVLEYQDEKVLEIIDAAIVWHKESARVLREIRKAHLTKRAVDGCPRGGNHVVLAGSNKCVQCGKRVNHRN